MRKATTCAGFLVLALGAVACGGATIDPGDGGGGDSGQNDAAPDTWGPYPCGSNTCGSSEICIHPCCGGAMPMCDPFLDDAGTCPPGDTPSTQCYGPNGLTSGCQPPPCTPPPPYCAPANQCMPNGPGTTRDCYEMCA